ncbi:Abi-like protein [Cohaesibacter marisflavi]|uniref:Abi-like protein n=1 Tax=Cohaesibacter marisflavi TaxID=655353 RepID=A0A1I5NPM3_9HYPH|nr:Abi family protein [Cohaesibacter marisflavi]SFP23171.1 Abi-like protein [Cohaesibacter marisflavi]
MAESQVPYSYDVEAIAALKGSLSEPRFATYLAKASGNETFAFALYLYNVKLAKSFLFPLSVTEVTLRNAVDSALLKIFGAAWHEDANFRDTVLTPQSLSTLDKAIERARSNARDKVIAELTFDFWSNLFRNEYSNLWRTKANIAFPGLSHGEGRRQIQTLVKEINRLRNRVAHYEPILDLNVPDLQSKMIKLVELRCKITADWMRHHSTVSAVMRSRPNLAGSAPVTLESKTDKRFIVVERTSKLACLANEEAQTCSAFVCMENENIVGAITHEQLGQYMATAAMKLDGMVDLNDHSIADVLNIPAVANGFRSMTAESSFFDAVKILKEPKTRVIVAVSPDDGAPIGVILRAHRRY